MSNGLYAKLKALADSYGESVSVIIRNILRRELEGATRDEE